MSFLEGSERSKRSDPCRIIILEDLHWCDDISLDLMFAIARRIAQQPSLLVLTYRSDEVAPALAHFLAQLERERLAHEIALDRLTADQTREVSRAIFNQTQVRAEFLEAIQARTDGNPFFIEETLKALVSAGDIYTERGVWTRKPLSELSIPRTVQDAVQRRAEHTSDDAQRTLAVAAVIGQRFDFELLHTVTNMAEPELLHSLRELIAAQLVVESTADEFAFRHALTREAVYGSLLRRERRRLHLAVGGALEAAGGREGASRVCPTRSHRPFHAGDRGKATHPRRGAPWRVSIPRPRASLRDHRRVRQRTRRFRDGVAGSDERRRRARRMGKPVQPWVSVDVARHAHGGRLSRPRVGDGAGARSTREARVQAEPGGQLALEHGAVRGGAGVASRSAGHLRRVGRRGGAGADERPTRHRQHAARRLHLVGALSRHGYRPVPRTRSTDEPVLDAGRGGVARRLLSERRVRLSIGERRGVLATRLGGDSAGAADRVARGRCKRQCLSGACDGGARRVCPFLDLRPRRAGYRARH